MNLLNQDDIEIVDAIPPVTVIYALDEDTQSPILYLDSEQVSADALAGQLDAVFADVAEEDRRIIFKGDQRLPYSELEPILEAIAEASVPVVMSGEELR